MTRFNVLKTTEGGIGQKLALQRLRDANIKCRPASSVFIGHTAVEVMSNNKRVIRRAERILFS